MICASAVAGATCTYVSLNVRYFAAQIFSCSTLGQSRSKPSFPRLGREAIIGKAPSNGCDQSIQQTLVGRNA